MDLLENYKELPIEIQNILLEINDQDDYNTCEETIKKLELHGYTADYDLNGCLFDLKKI